MDSVLQVPLPVRAVILLIALLSIFWLPWIVSLIAMFAAGLVFAPAALAIGVLADLMYYPGHGLLTGTLEGLILTLLAAAVRHFVKTRIM